LGKFDDKGIFGPNKYRKGNDRAPTHKGVVDLSHETLKALLAAYQDTGTAKLEIAGWRKDGNPDQISLKVSLPREQDSRGGGRDRDREDDRGRSNERSRGSVRRDDDDRGYDDRDDRRARSYDEEPPFEERRSARRDDDRGRDRDEDHGRRRGRDLGDERDL